MIKPLYRCDMCGFLSEELDWCPHCNTLMPQWKGCEVKGCHNRCCLALGSKKCFPCTVDAIENRLKDDVVVTYLKKDVVRNIIDKLIDELHDQQKTKPDHCGTMLKVKVEDGAIVGFEDTEYLPSKDREKMR